MVERKTAIYSEKKKKRTAGQNESPPPLWHIPQCFLAPRVPLCPELLGAEKFSSSSQMSNNIIVGFSADDGQCEMSATLKSIL